MDGEELLKVELQTADTLCNECVAISTSLTSDENKNQICEAQPVSSSDEIIGGNEQDLINNNEEDSDQTGPEIKQNDCIGADDHVNIKVSNSITIPNSKPSVEKKMVCNSNVHSILKAIPSDGLIKSQSTDICKGSDELGERYQQDDRQRRLQTLLNCIQKAIESNDCSTLPHLLHQVPEIAEIYFDEEEYEKAIQFIQLEKVYHQKLLANLTAIQECWEVKQKSAMTRETSAGKAIKSLDTDRITKLTELCSSHCRPNIPGGKFSVSAECFYKNECHFTSKEQDACKKITAEHNSSFTDQLLGTKVQTAKYDYALLEMMEDGKEESTVPLQAAVLVGKSCSREPAMYAAETLPEEQLEARRAKSRIHSDVETEHSYSENIKADEICLQPHATTPCKDVPTATKAIETECETQVVTNAALFHHEDIDNLQDNLTLAGKTTEESEEINLKCSKTVQFITNGETMPKHSNHVLQNHVRSNSSDCVHGDSWNLQNISDSEGTLEADGQTAKQNHTSVLSEINKSYQRMGSGVEQEIQSHVEFSECQISNEDAEKQGDENMEGLSSFEHNISSSQRNGTEELLQFNDNSLSLDELAKRIQIEESIHPEGLVSILKKGRSGKEITQAQQKQSKRRVRFQDPEDALDQDEVNGDSCLLLILLCIFTVLLSILGTALYCTFGDLESTVCRDFTSQMDFYFTQFQQGFAKVKHWLLFS
ncbi:consortin isoform X3 [Hypanus sabinus]|uniref:consortin isoform X3 n=1 Tax=Hypanus sabinus TaxID=79690 RepID=UPI0028C446A6|nr:consortin isoform X3 [Hypanus sabinus]